MAMSIIREVVASQSVASNLQVTVDTVTNPVPVDQHVIVDANNSSTTNLAVGNSYTFTGVGTDTLGVAGIQVTLKTDQNCTVQVEQSPDNTNWDIIDSYNYYASINNFGVTVQAVNSYVRVVVVTASLTTTYFRLQTCLCPIVEALPRSLDESGNLKTAIRSIQDGYGFSAEMTPMGELRAVIPSRLVGTNFEGTTVDSNFWTATSSGTGASAAQTGGQAVLTPGTANAGYSRFYTVRRARYTGGSVLRFRSVIRLSEAGVADNTRKWGALYGASLPTVTDGAYFQFSGTTFQVVTLKGSSATAVSSGSFNGTLGTSYSPGSSVATYEIYWTNSKVYFVIGDEILHTVSATSTTWSETMSFYAFMDSVNSAAISVGTGLIYCRAMTIYRLGQLLTQPQAKYQSGTTAGLVLKYSPGNLHSVILSGISNNAVVTLYDNTAASGTIMWSSGSMGANAVPFALSFNGAPFSVGLTLVIATAAANATIIYE
jgi:hypothetical protein